MSEAPDFLTTVRRMQSQIEYLLGCREVEELQPFNELLTRMKGHWLENEQLSEELRDRVEALPMMNVARKKMKYSWLSRVTVFGAYEAERFAVDELHDQLKDVRSRLASIEFIYKMEA